MPVLPPSESLFPVGSTNDQGRHRFWIGSMGPFFADANKTYRPEEIDGKPIDDTPIHAFRSTGPILVGEPSHKNHASTLGTIQAQVGALRVSDIANPTELEREAGRYDGAVRMIYQRVVGGADLYTLYAWDSTPSDEPDPPERVRGAGGSWVAIGGEYVYGRGSHVHEVDVFRATGGTASFSTRFAFMPGSTIVSADKLMQAPGFDYAEKSDQSGIDFGSNVPAGVLIVINYAVSGG